jgi:transcription elongation factor GreA
MHLAQTKTQLGNIDGDRRATPQVFYGDIDGQRPLLTPEEYELYRAQLADLHRIRDRDLPELLRQARGFVANDAVEEISQIQEDQIVVDARIAQLESLLREARVITAREFADDVAAIGRTVTVRYRGTGTLATYHLRGSAGTDGRTVSAGSPVGRALLGRLPGDAVSVELPGGRVEELEVLAVDEAEKAAA